MKRVVAALFPFGRYDPRARRLVFLMWLVGVLASFASSHASSTIPFSRVSLGLTEGDMSLVLAVARFAGIGALAFSWWGDRAGRRRPFLIAFVLLIVATGATAWVETGWQFAALQAVSRAAAAALGTLAVVLVAEQVSPDIRAFSISLYGAGGSFGAGLGLIALPLAEVGPNGWRGLFALGAIGLVALPLLVRGVEESPVFTREDPRELIRTAPLRDLLLSAYSSRLYLTGAINFLVNVFVAVTLAFSIERLVGDIGLPTTTAVLLSLFGGTAGAAGFFLGGRLADTLGRRVTTVLSLALVLAGGLVLYWTDILPLVATGIAVGTFGSFAFVPAAASHRTELFPTAFRTTANATGSYLGMVGSAVGLLVGRFTIDPLGLSTTVTVLGVGILGGIALTLRLPETRGQELGTVGR